MFRIGKKLNFGLAIMALLLIASACGTSNNAEESTTAEGKAEGAVTRSYESAKGAIEIPVKPLRIVTDYYGGELLAVGGNVVGIEPTAFGNPFLKELLKDSEDVGMPFNLEKISELKPDLIVVMRDGNYEQLSKIAPTLHVPFGTATNIYETLRLFGDIVGDTEKAEAVIAEYDKKVADTRTRLADVVGEGETFGIYELVDNGELWLFGDYAGRGGQPIYHGLGYPAPGKFDPSEQTFQLSMEVLSEYAGDYMFLTVYDPEKKGEVLKEIQASGVWQNLDAVKNNRVFINDYDTWYPNDPLAIIGQLDLLVTMLTERAAENGQ